MKTLDINNDINNYRAEFRNKIPELCKAGRISEALKDEFILVDSILRETDKSIAEFLAFMSAVKPEDLEEADIPEAVKDAIEYHFKDYKSINFSVEAKKAMVYTAFQTTKFYHLQITDRYMELLEEIADTDTDLSNTLMELKSFIDEQE